MPKRKAEDVSEPAQVAQEEEEEERSEAHLSEGSEDDATDSSSFEDDDEEDEDASSDDSDGEAFDSVTVDLDFAQPEEGDFLGLKTLLTNYLDGEKYDSSGLADLVLKHKEVSTIIRCGEDTIGFTAVVPLDTSVPSLKQLQRFLQKHAKTHAPKVKELFEDKSSQTSLLLSERLINCPPDVAPAMHSALLEDLDSAKLKIKNLLVVAQAFREGQELIYTQPETECWHKQATWSCEFNCAEGEAGAQKKGCRRVRLVLLIPFAKMKAAGAALEKLLEAHE